jgi:hypothetical protein
MREIFTMWRHTQMVVLVALSAAIYAAVLIPFKGFTIIPGFTEVRPANVFPFVFGLLFGPAGAWGAVIGKPYRGLFFGTLGIGSNRRFIETIPAPAVHAVGIVSSGAGEQGAERELGQDDRRLRGRDDPRLGGVRGLDRLVQRPL